MVLKCSQRTNANLVQPCSSTSGETNYYFQMVGAARRQSERRPSKHDRSETFPLFCSGPPSSSSPSKEVALYRHQLTSNSKTKLIEFTRAINLYFRPPAWQFRPSLLIYSLAKRSHLESLSVRQGQRRSCIFVCMLDRSDFNTFTKILKIKPNDLQNVRSQFRFSIRFSHAVLNVNF